MRKALQLGRYHLFDRIAFGGMAEIYRAKTFDSSGNAHWVAVKRVLAHLVEDEDFIQMLVDEAKIASQVRHPNIARVYEFTQAHGEFFIAMEHVDGKDLRTMLERCRQRKESMPPHHASYVAAEVATALQAAHNALDGDSKPLGIVHRDVSPSNVLCAFSGEVKLCDFGIAKASLSRVQTKTGVIKGKVKYMSPEQALGHKVDHRSDIFSLGVCLYEMLTRQPPFSAVNEMDLILRVRDAKYKPVRSVSPEVPEELEAVCDKCLAKKVGNRYQNAGEVAADLRAYLDKARPGYSRTQLGRYVRKLFAEDIDLELRQLEEFILADDVHDDLGENLIAPALGPGAEYSQFSPRPSHSMDTHSHAGQRPSAGGSGGLGSQDRASQMISDADLDANEFDIHDADTLILAGGKNQASARAPEEVRDERALASTEYAGARDKTPARNYDPKLHSAPTRILQALSDEEPEKKP
jgi:eukaryotic-like serine/threonine-protein kinase